MLRKEKRLTWIAVTMSVLLALDCACGQLETTTRRVRHQRSSNRGGGSGSADVNLELEREFQRNLDLVNSRQWKCGDPKPRLVYFNESLDNVSQEPHLKWLLEATVLHRCEAALGCCSAPNECRPVHSEEVLVTFKRINMATNETGYRRIRFTNHTSCACAT